MNLRIAAENLLIIRKILDRIGLRYWLMFGTWLGAYRDGKIIPYDGDVDLAMYTEDIPRMWRHLGSFLNEGFIIDIVPGDTTFHRYREHTDIYPFTLMEDKRFWGEINYDVSAFETYSDIEFLGQRFRILSDSERWLEYTYGKDWRTPIKNKGIKGQPLGE